MDRVDRRGKDTVVPRAWFAQGTSSGPWSNHSREKGQQNHKKWGWIGKQTNPDSVLKSRDIARPNKVHIVKAVRN